MQRYKNLNGHSGVRGYEIYPERIEVQFSDGRIYSYSYKRAGERRVENMKVLACQGYGLNSYINRYVKYLYD